MQQKNTRELIFRQAIRLIGQYGYEAVSMRQIAAAVGIQGGSLYNHFSSKAEIMDGIVEFFQEMLQENLVHGGGADSEEETAFEVLLGFITVFAEDKLTLLLEMYRILFTELYRNKELRTFFMEFLIHEPEQKICAALERLAADGKIPPCNGKALAAMWTRTFLMNGMEATHHLNREEDSGKRYMQMAEFFLTQALGRTLTPQERRELGKKQYGE